MILGQLQGSIEPSLAHLLVGIRTVLKQKRNGLLVLLIHSFVLSTLNQRLWSKGRA